VNSWGTYRVSIDRLVQVCKWDSIRLVSRSVCTFFSFSFSQTVSHFSASVPE